MSLYKGGRLLHIACYDKTRCLCIDSLVYKQTQLMGRMDPQLIGGTSMKYSYILIDGAR
jgi:hypothetical protein